MFVHPSRIIEQMPNNTDYDLSPAMVKTISYLYRLNILLNVQDPNLSTEDKTILQDYIMFM